jgi:hypothetical protein
VAVFGWLRRFIFNYVFSTLGLGEAVGDMQVGVMQAVLDEREESSQQARSAAELGPVVDKLGP